MLLLNVDWKHKYSQYLVIFYLSIFLNQVLVLLEEKECKIAESVDVPKALGDLFEALLGAIFIDSGKNFSTVWRCIYRLMANEICKFWLIHILDYVLRPLLIQDMVQLD